MPARICEIEEIGVAKKVDLAAEEALHRRAAALVRDVHDVDLRHDFQELPG